MNSATSALLQLLQTTLEAAPQEALVASLTRQEWQDVIKLSFEQGVASLAVDGYNALDTESLLETDELDDLRYEWFARVFITEEDNRYKFRKAARFANTLLRKGVECHVLKGMSFATYYHNPEHRECGDCDVYLGDGFYIGNEVAQSMGGRYEFGTYKHSHLFFGRLMIENHHYLTDFNATKQGKKIELLLENAIRETPGRAIGESDLLCPNDHFNALFLIKHAHGNFIYGGLILRMIYDWAAMLESSQDKLDWKRLNADFTECKLLDFAALMTSLCVDYLGLKLTQPDIPLCADPALVNEVMEDTLAGGINIRGKETFPKKCLRIARRFSRIWHYRRLATETVPRMIWNNFAYSSYLKRNIELSSK